MKTKRLAERISKADSIEIVEELWGEVLACVAAVGKGKLSPISASRLIFEIVDAAKAAKLWAVKNGCEDFLREVERLNIEIPHYD